LGKLLAEDLAGFVHLIHLLAALSLGTFENNDSPQETIPDFFLALEQFVAPSAEFFELFFACFEVLLLPLQLNQLMLPLLELCA
jgi:hypothetical protein